MRQGKTSVFIRELQVLGDREERNAPSDRPFRWSEPWEYSCTFTILLKDSTVALSSRHLLERPSAHRNSNEVDEVEVTKNGGAELCNPQVLQASKIRKGKEG